MYQVIQLHVAAPPKPEAGRPCNGCGVCCVSEPCPVGVIVSRRWRGACAALVWNDGEATYRCGLIEQPARFLPKVLRRAAPWVARRAYRYVAAGRGCDSSVIVDGG